MHDNYAPVYWIEVLRLPNIHPKGHVALNCGEFAAQRPARYGFSKVHHDLKIKRTLNSDSKSKGRLSELTQSMSAVFNRLFSRHDRARFAQECFLIANRDIEARNRKDLDASHANSHEKAIIKVIETVSSMINPFNIKDKKLVKISSGSLASDEVASGLLKTKIKGKAAFLSLCNDRIMNSN